MARRLRGPNGIGTIFGTVAGFVLLTSVAVWNPAPLFAGYCEDATGQSEDDYCSCDGAMGASWECEPDNPDHCIWDQNTCSRACECTLILE